MDELEDLIAAINAGLRARGWSAQHASMVAVGSNEFVKDIRRGRLRQVAKFRKLCEALELEFYVGPAREFDSVDERRLGVAVETTMRALESANVRLEPAELTRAFVAIYELLGEGQTPANAARVRRLVAALTSGERIPGKGTSD
ncbi:MAG: hypothetical protein OXC01_16040 [Immundisolibacterales bacterium]|nr:hypothetical protein [Immundisolibacterales bacterium]